MDRGTPRKTFLLLADQVLDKPQSEIWFFGDQFSFQKFLNKKKYFTPWVSYE